MTTLKKRGGAPWLIVALLAALAAPVWGQSQPTEANMAQLDIGDGKVTFDVRGRTLAEVVERIRDKTKVNIFLSKEAAAATVTIKIQDLHWLNALQEVAEKAECILERASPIVIKVYKPERVTFSFENEDVKKVVSVIATYSGANIVVSPEVKGTITVNLKNIPWRDALEQIVKTLGYAVVEEDRDILRIVPRADLQQQLETRVIRLKYIRPPSPYRAYISSEYTKEKIDAYDSKTPEKEFPVLQALQAAVETEGGTIQSCRPRRCGSRRSRTRSSLAVRSRRSTTCSTSCSRSTSSPARSSST